MPHGPVYAVEVYVPDKDTIQTAATISLLSDFQAHFGLDLVQPSLCSPADSYTSRPLSVSAAAHCPALHCLGGRDCASLQHDIFAEKGAAHAAACAYR